MKHGNSYINTIYYILEILQKYDFCANLKSTDLIKMTYDF